MAGYLEKMNWRDGTTEWTRNELPGLRVVEELFGRRPVYYTTEFNNSGEVCTKGVCNFAGYHKNQKETDKALDADGSGQVDMSEYLAAREE